MDSVWREWRSGLQRPDERHWRGDGSAGGIGGMTASDVLTFGGEILTLNSVHIAAGKHLPMRPWLYRWRSF